jgi:hypothetical protein
MTRAERILDYHYNLHFEGQLPEGISWLNPFEDTGNIKRIIHEFYHKFYSDTQPRTLILGINPGRLGAGATGIPFTDTKRLISHCGIPCQEFKTHEPSSVFIYDVIEAYGGATKFYKDFYINSVCPLGFVLNKNNKKVNFNYYDSKALLQCVEPFIIENIKTQIEIAGLSERVYCLGTGKNFDYLSRINHLYGFFKEIIPLEHPRFIMQYKNKEKDSYIKQYLNKLHLNQRKY